MLNAALLAVAIQAPVPVDDCCGHAKPVTYVERLVETAWQKSDAQQQPKKLEETKIDEKRQKDLDRDVELGKEYSKLVEKELKLSEDEAAIRRVGAIGKEMAAIANSYQADVTWGDKRPSHFN